MMNELMDDVRGVKGGEIVDEGDDDLDCYY